VRESAATQCFNQEAFIAKALDSVRSQSYTDWEYIVVNPQARVALTGKCRKRKGTVECEPVEQEGARRAPWKRATSGRAENGFPQHRYILDNAIMTLKRRKFTRR
jgi:hypothetical protein